MVYFNREWKELPLSGLMTFIGCGVKLHCKLNLYDYRITTHLAGRYYPPFGEEEGRAGTDTSSEERVSQLRGVGAIVEGMVHRKLTKQPIPIRSKFRLEIVRMHRYHKHQVFFSCQTRTILIMVYLFLQYELECNIYFLLRLITSSHHRMTEWTTDHSRYSLHSHSML